MESSLVVLPKVKHRITIWARNSSPKYVPQRIEIWCSSKNLHTNIHSISIHNSQKFETTQMSTSRGADKQYVWCACSGILLSCTKEGSTDICHDTDEPWKHHAKWEKPNTKGHGSYDSIYMKIQKRPIQRARKQLVVARSWRRGSGEWLLHG